jgi:hypothetical protein
MTKALAYGMLTVTYLIALGSFHILLLICQMIVWLLMPKHRGYHYHRWRKGMTIKARVNYNFTPRTTRR